MSLFYRLFKKFNLITANQYKKHLVSAGVKIGPHTKLFSSRITIDEQRPWLIEIGDYCKITEGVVILSHDYSRSVLRRAYGELLREGRKTIIGDNVFLGMNSIVLMGSKIGNNVIVGAGSIVSGVIPDNVVVGGNPARIIRSLQEHYQIRKERLLSEAKETFIEFRNKYKRNPTITEMGQFFPLYLPRNKELLKKYRLNTNLSADNSEEIIEFWLNTEPQFDSFEAFVDFVLRD